MVSVHCHAHQRISHQAHHEHHEMQTNKDPHPVRWINVVPYLFENVLGGVTRVRIIVVFGASVVLRVFIAAEVIHVSLG